MENKPRKPWVAGLLAFSTIGLGHIYSGEANKGFFLYFFGQGMVLAVVLPLMVKKPDIVGVSFSLIIGLVYFLYTLIDAVRTSKRKKIYYSQQKINKWYIYLLCWVFAGFVIQPVITYLIRIHIIQSYKIPSGAMTPALLAGDWILVSKSIYKTNVPQRGDIIVFEYPNDPSLDYVKRLVGVAGDIIEIKNKKLYVNNVEQGDDYIIHSDARTLSVSEHPRDNFGPVTVPPDSYFVLGDNRDNSFDSRFWGFVSSPQILGKVTSIYWSWDKEAGQIRWERIGDSVE